MKIGVILESNDPEIVWNAFRFGVAMLDTNHAVSIFLLGSGVEAQEIQNSTFTVKEQISAFFEKDGEILACGTCLKARNKGGTPICPIHTMNDLVKLVEESDKIITFG